MYPQWSLVFFPVFAGGAADVGFEDSGKMAGGGKAQVGTNGGYGFVGIAEEAFGFLRFFFEDEVCQALAGFFFELSGKVGAAEKEMACDLVYGDGLGEVLLDVIGHVHRQLGGVFSQVQPLYPLGIVQDHAVLEVHNVPGGGKKLTLADIGIAVGKGLVHIHAAPDGGPGNQGGADNKGIFPLPQLLLGQNAATDRRGPGNPFLQRCGIPLADLSHEHLLQIEGIVQALGRIRPRRQLLGCLHGVLPGKELLLIPIVNGDVLQRQGFPIQNMVEGAEHLQDAFKTISSLRKGF